MWFTDACQFLLFSFWSVQSLTHTYTHSKLYLFCSSLLPWKNIILSEYLFYSLHSLTRRYISILSFLWRLILMVIWLPESTARELFFLSFFLIPQKYGKKSFLGFKKKRKEEDTSQWVSVVVSALSCLPPVHMQMSLSLIVSSYFNLLCGGSGDGEVGSRLEKGRLEEKMRERETDDGHGKRGEDWGCLLRG